ncbi:MAG: DUF1015 domain-containing protein [Phycisphaerales bacterium]|nr:DUF1015 domain-containing protein [Phycisphaerales bacterium]
MADIRPFFGIRYAPTFAPDFSNLIAPPYDVLDESGKAALLQKHDKNIVAIDLPHLPPKTAGPDIVYDQAATTFQQWLAEGTLRQDHRRCLYPYVQSYSYRGKTFHRHGLIASVRLTPFGQDIIPHERTYKGPIEDRLQLMRKTGAQLSPVFGLFSDPQNDVTTLLFKNASRPQFSGELDQVRNDLWSTSDTEIENQIVDLFKGKKIYIADGHHRYTTALQYQLEQQQLCGGNLPPNHPANFCMFVLVSMQDPGLIIQATHRILGGLSAFDFDEFRRIVSPHFDVKEIPLGSNKSNDLAGKVAHSPQHTFGLYDGRSGQFHTLTLKNPDLLQSYEPDRSQAWRQLDVAILQRYLLDEVLQPHFAGGQELAKAYTADAHNVVSLTDGQHYQIALLLQPTPLSALEELGRHGEVMPQKSTYFYPKLATGMVINPLKS